VLGRLRNSKRAVVVALLLSLLAIPAVGPAAGEGAPAASAAAPYQCTPWTSLTRPPESIWVHIPIKKGRRYKMGERVQVDFKTYVERVVIDEWGPNETRATPRRCADCEAVRLVVHHAPQQEAQR
jgi:hypothetical protein